MAYLDVGPSPTCRSSHIQPGPQLAWGPMARLQDRVDAWGLQIMVLCIQYIYICICTYYCSNSKNNKKKNSYNHTKNNNDNDNFMVS